MTSFCFSPDEDASVSESLTVLIRSNDLRITRIKSAAPVITRHPDNSLRLNERKIIAKTRQITEATEYCSIFFFFTSKLSPESRCAVPVELNSLVSTALGSFGIYVKLRKPQKNYTSVEIFGGIRKKLKFVLMV